MGCSVECMQVGRRVVRVVGWLCRVYAGGWKSSKSCGLLCRVYAGGGRVVRVVGCSVECMQVGGRVVSSSFTPNSPFLG